MDWTRFDTRGENKDEAFEALTALLFERFCRREYGAALRHVWVPDGAGGDGGVDACARLASGEEVGLQAKWFRGAFGRGQIRQIEKSLRAAIKSHPRLVRYCVAVPRNLNKTQRPKWDACVAKAKTVAPGTTIDLWDEARLHELLSEQENEGVFAYWFTDSVITLDDLEQRFRKDENGWLSGRYLPELHASSALEQDLALHLGEPAARAALRRQVRAARNELTGVREDVARLANYPIFMDSDADAHALREAALVALKKLLGAGKKLYVALQKGKLVRGSIPFGIPEENALRRLDDALERLKATAGSYRAPTHDIHERLRGSLWERNAPLPILRAWKQWQGSDKIAAFFGPPGIGKTHGLADAVRARLKKRQPALLLRAKDCPLEEGWVGILRKALDQPTLKLDELLNGFEALAVRADFWRAQKKKPGKVDREPTCFLLAIDGLEESGRHGRWAELLGELSGHLERHPRIRAAVTLRTSSAEAILGRVKREAFVARPLPHDDSKVQELLRKYCEHRDYK